MQRSITVALLAIVVVGGCRTAPREYWTPPPGTPSPYFRHPQPLQPAPQFQQMTPPIPAPTPPYNGQPPAEGIPPVQQQVEYRWRAPDVRLYPPQGITAPTNPTTPAPPSTEPPLLGNESKAGLPVSIPQFATVNPKVSSGLKPSADDGLDWLRAAGYRAVLHIHAPGADVAQDRQEIEKRGLTYLDLEVSPQSLSKDIVERFTRIVGDTVNLPLFVYDRHGALAGGLWYLHFRMSESLPDDGARLRAHGLGLREDEGDHRLMWLAVQRILSELPR